MSHQRNIDCVPVSFSSRTAKSWVSTWNHIVLLYGPPGTGKTSLCRALAQKLSIRIGNIFPCVKMVEINAHSLSCRFFGESGKLVTRMFQQVETMLDQENDTFICVFIDEVETITTQRERSMASSDPLDAMKAVNALLTSLDRLRDRPNVLLLCTSNLVASLVNPVLRY